MATNNIVNVGLSGFTGAGSFVGSNSPTITTPKIAQINDTNGNSILQFSTVASAVNSFEIFNNSTGNGPILFCIGSDTNIPLTIESKGTGLIGFVSTATSNQIQWSFSGSNQNIFNFSAATGTNTFTFPAASGTVLLSGASQTLGAITATSINFGGSTLSTYATGTWTPIDASGASLTFSTAAGTYTQIGNMVICTGYVVYPSTVNGANAIIGGLPVTTGSTNQKMGGYVVDTTVTTLSRAITLTTNTAFSLFTSAGAAVLNSAMTLSTSTFQLIYFI